MDIKKIDKKTNKAEIVIELIKRGYTFTEAVKKVGIRNES